MEERSEPSPDPGVRALTLLCNGRFSEVICPPVGLIGNFHYFLDHTARGAGAFVIALVIDGGTATVWVRYDLDGYAPVVPPTDIMVPDVESGVADLNQRPEELAGLPTWRVVL